MALKISFKCRTFQFLRKNYNIKQINWKDKVMNLKSHALQIKKKKKKLRWNRLTIQIYNWRIIKKLYKPFLMISTRLLYLIDGCFLFNKIPKSIANDLHQVYDNNYRKQFAYRRIYEKEF